MLEPTVNIVRVCSPLEVCQDLDRRLGYMLHTYTMQCKSEVCAVLCEVGPVQSLWPLNIYSTASAGSEKGRLSAEDFAVQPHCCQRRVSNADDTIKVKLVFIYVTLQKSSTGNSICSSIYALHRCK